MCNFGIGNYAITLLLWRKNITVYTLTYNVKEFIVHYWNWNYVIILFCGGKVSFYFVGHEYSPTMRRNLIYTSLSEFVGYVCYVEKEEWNYCSMKISALWNLTQWTHLS